MTSQAAAAPRSPLARLFATSGGFSAFVLRLTLAVVLFPHGAQKLLGWWGGHGFAGTRDFLVGQIGLPPALAVFIILLEFFGPILLVLGLFTRPVALAVIGLMIGAIQTVHRPYGFFMNWTGAQEGEGFEYHLLVIGIGVALLVLGAGSASLDARIGGGSRR